MKTQKALPWVRVRLSPHSLVKLNKISKATKGSKSFFIRTLVDAQIDTLVRLINKHFGDNDGSAKTKTNRK